MNKSIQLFILPHSGGKVAQFNMLMSHLDDRIEVIPIEYAGRGTRIKEPFFEDYNSFVEDIRVSIERKRNKLIPFAILGYSIGGIFTYDLLAKKCLAEYPSQIFIGACEHMSDLSEKLSSLPEDEFWDRIIAFGGIEEKLIKNKKFLKLFSKTLRADFHIVEQYIYSEADSKISCPATIMYCEEDTPLNNVKKWNDVSNNIIEYQEFIGGHFFILVNHESVAELLNKKLINIHSEIMN